MGISTSQRTDRWVGAPLCAILTVLRRIFESARRPGPRQVERILFVKFAEQGSTVLAYPAILRAIELVGRENVYVVVFEDNRFILDAMEIIPYQNVIARDLFQSFRMGSRRIENAPTLAKPVAPSTANKYEFSLLAGSIYQDTDYGATR